MDYSKLLPSLYVINKHAKKFADDARRSYKSNAHAEAEINSNRKEALYELKHQVLIQIAQEASRIEKHKIDTSQYYHLEFTENGNTWDFHIPIEKLQINSSKIKEEKTLSSFSKDSRLEKSTLPLKTALNQIYDEIGLNANDYIPTNTYQTESEWTYLYGAY